MSSVLGLCLVVVGIVLLAMWIGRGNRPLRQTRLLLLGLGTSVVGSLGYLLLVGGYYGGGDYLLYYRAGLEYSALLTGGEWEEALLQFVGEGGQWWGTAFTIHLSGLLFALIGPTQAGAFLVFGLLGYAGVLCIWVAARRSFPDFNANRYLRWLVLYPSLWFWAGALGKDAVVLFGVGLATVGLAGRDGRTRWVTLGLGLAAVFVIRPQVAATLGFALVAGHWLATVNHFSLVRGVQGVALLAAGVGVVTMASGALGFELFDSQAVTEYVDSRSSVSQRGGSAIEGLEGGVSLWLAPVNTLFRPFPWEANGITGLLASIEMLVLWVVAWRRRGEVVSFVRAYRHTPLLWMSLVFVLLYATALGMAIGNFGILARQRVHILPFLLLLIAGARERPGTSPFSPSAARPRGRALASV